MFDNNNVEYNIILGTNFLSKTGIKLNYSEGNMEWFDCSIPLCPPGGLDSKEFDAMEDKSPSHTLTVASDTMAEDGETAKSAEMESEKLMSTTGKDQACKSKEIAITPAHVQKETLTVTPVNQKINKREQKLSRKK